MRVLALEIDGFRGIPHGRFILSKQQAFIGPNGGGKSTLVDALNLVFGRQKLVRTLTEHDFTRSAPKAADRIRIVATLGGFQSNDPDRHANWFRHGRAVPKWWDSENQQAVPIENQGRELCVQIGFAARFDREDLEVKTVRYFHDDDTRIDPFDEDNIARFPDRLLQEIGYFALPTKRTWAATISFASDLFRKAVATLGGIPADAILEQVNNLRNPASPLEEQTELRPLVEGINQRLAQLLPDSPRLQLRVTGTDSEAFLTSLVPHYAQDGQESLPAGRHGTGLISLQTLALLLEIGKARKERGQSFILALEEPELHVPPGLQRRLIGDAASIADQIITTTHSPRVAAFFESAMIQVLHRTTAAAAVSPSEPPTPGGQEGGEQVEGRTLIPSSLIDAPNALIQLFTETRVQVVESLMYRRVLVPEGRTDFEWLRLLVDVVETGVQPVRQSGTIPPFSAVVGVVPTRSSHVTKTFEHLSFLHPRVSCLVDGDAQGDNYVTDLTKLDARPRVVFQWPKDWQMEDVVHWVLGDDGDVLMNVNQRLGRDFADPSNFLAALREKVGANGGLKEHYFAHEEIAGCLKHSQPCVQRAATVLEAITRVLLEAPDDFPHLSRETERTGTVGMAVFRFKP